MTDEPVNVWRAPGDYRTVYAGTVCACGAYFEARSDEAVPAMNRAYAAHAATCLDAQTFSEVRH